MNPNKNPMVAFVLSFIPGLGHLYLGRPVKALLYGGGFFGSLLLLVVMVAARVHRIFGYNEFPYFFMLFVAFVIWAVNLIDVIRTLLGRSQPANWGTAGADPHDPMQGEPNSSVWGPTPAQDSQINDRFITILLSFVPGLGHFQLGLMQRGLAFLVTFFGLTIMIFFVTALTNREEFLAFLGVLPIIWLYCMFDCVQQLNRKHRGEELVDRSIFEDFQDTRESGKKNKTLAMLLSIFPGAGHMYLGLQKRGLQLMAAFLFGIYIMDVLRLSLFLFLIPIIWFFSFFDGLQYISRYGREEIRDVPVVDWLMHHQRWIGVGLLGLGLYYLVDNVLINGLDRWLDEQMSREIIYWYRQYFHTFIVCVLLIGGGLRLLFGSKRGKGERT
ncbi:MULTISPECIES: hypothetical protein [unclassified Paenibacillus]|uniref:hypothetical protein n=1 Tax=unclassified Paenibacillus TaxID=185978 RepID=UPI001AE6D55F|nr:MULTISPECIES: hypothetical protein [unclassified Paenibacillus]MBP1153228.1 TM2 domain-containing membrane protein YozV [Paenibacillus sp. PvP091]MBP1171389.1 TM2 domain-containing membrane protein YozV [Paenibacillus sp. PvR098]MBP2442417.1 TM2 domain-containing membrane protein YozV [Paenibacillus sp. PvP052]